MSFSQDCNLYTLKADLDANPVLADEIYANPDLVDVWVKAKNTPDWARQNHNFLKKLYELDPGMQDQIIDFYTTTMKTQLPKGFNGGGKSYGGVWFNEYGFPDFQHFGQCLDKKYFYKGAKGNYDTDFTDAKNWLSQQDGIEAIDDYNGLGSPLNVKINGSWKKITWHHHEDGTTLIPVFTEIHTGLKHVGGVKTVKLGINDFFNYIP